MNQLSNEAANNVIVIPCAALGLGHILYHGISNICTMLLEQIKGFAMV